MSGLVVPITVVPSCTRVVETACDSGLGVGVDGARRLHENENFCIRQQRARQDEPLTLSSREGTGAFVNRGVETLGQGLQHVLGIRDADRGENLLVVGRPAPRVELRAQSPGEQDGVCLADHDPAANGVRVQVGKLNLPEQDAVVAAEAPEPVGDRGHFVGIRRDQARERARLDDQTRPEIGQRHSRGRLVRRRIRLRDMALDGQNLQHPAGADIGARHLVDGLGGRAEGNHKERRVAVERDQLAGADLSREREARPEPGDEDDEEPGHEDLRGVESRLRQGNADARESNLLGTAPVPVEELRLAADPT